VSTVCNVSVAGDVYADHTGVSLISFGRCTFVGYEMRLITDFFQVVLAVLFSVMPFSMIMLMS
jgi:hypothetical protein